MACDFFGEDPTHRVYPNLVWQLKLEPWSNISQGIPAQKGLNGLKYGYDKHRDCKRNSSLSENGWPTKSLISPRVMGNSWLVSWVNHPFFIRNVTAGRFTKPNCTPPTHLLQHPWLRLRPCDVGSNMCLKKQWETARKQVTKLVNHPEWWSKMCIYGDWSEPTMSAPQTLCLLVNPI